MAVSTFWRGFGVIPDGNQLRSGNNLLLTHSHYKTELPSKSNGVKPLRSCTKKAQTSRRSYTSILKSAFLHSSVARAVFAFKMATSMSGEINLNAKGQEGTGQNQL